MNRIDSCAITDFFLNQGSEIYAKASESVKVFAMDDLINKGVLVGLSGGADSVLLLCFLVEYRRRLGLDFSIVAAHINHGIRGDEADADESFCEELCEALGIEIITEHLCVPSIAKNSRIGIEEAARNARYSSFSKIISGRKDIFAIAVAHNMSDNAETVIFNILRGSGARGASGISPVRDNIIRPLIKISKSDIVSALDSFGIPYVTDSTNLSTDYTRNYLRHEIIPRLERITDSPEKMLLRFSENMRSDDDFINECAVDFLEGKDEVTNNDLRLLHYSVFVRVLSIMAQRKLGGVSAKVASDIHNLLTKDNFSYSLIGDATFVCERGICRVLNSVDNSVDYCIGISEGLTHLDPFNADCLLTKEKVEKTYLNVYKIAIQADLSSAIINGRLYFRPKKDGDHVFYGGMTHKLKKLFSDRKIPPSKRTLLPILCDDKGVVWVPGFGVRDDGVKKENKQEIHILLGINPEKSEGKRLYSGSEFGT